MGNLFIVFVQFLTHSEFFWINIPEFHPMEGIEIVSSWLLGCEPVVWGIVGLGMLEADWFPTVPRFCTPCKTFPVISFVLFTASLVMFTVLPATYLVVSMAPLHAQPKTPQTHKKPSLTHSVPCCNRKNSVLSIFSLF